MHQRDLNAIAIETELHWNTVYKWSRNPERVSVAVRYAVRAAAKKLKIELPESADELR